jgi:hypothetical protein
MGKGRAVVVGVPQPSASSGWTASNLPGVMNDVVEMERLLRGLHFDVQVLVKSAAKAQAVLELIRDSASNLKPGDMFVFYFAGHGAQIKSSDGDELRDKLLLTFDEPIVDDLLGSYWPHFKKDVRIVVMTDSCHSATAVRTIETPRGVVTTIEPDPAETNTPHFLSIGLSNSGGERGVRDGNIAGLQGSLIHLAACLDREQAMDLGNHGAFTDAFLRAWNANFRENYDQLFAEIRKRMSFTTRQTPRMTTYGAYPPFYRGQKPLDPGIDWPPF